MPMRRLGRDDLRSGQRHEEFREITLGTVWEGIVIDGKVTATTVLPENCIPLIRRTGRQCNCGKIGCLETYARP